MIINNKAIINNICLIYDMSVLQEAMFTVKNYNSKYYTILIDYSIYI